LLFISGGAVITLLWPTTKESDDSWDDDALDIGIPSDPSHPAARIESARGKIRIVVLVRHGQAGDDTACLSTAGQLQAELVGKSLASRCTQACCVYHSAAKEARATAEIIAGCFAVAPAVIESSQLAEGIPLIPSPAPRELVEKSAEAEPERMEAAFHAHMWLPTGEIQDLVSAEVVVTHGNVIRYFLCRALQLPPEAWIRFGALHGSITWLTIDYEGGVKLLEFGGVGHLPKEHLTYA